MTIPIYVVDAFTDAAFKGNPAAVCLLDGPADETWMQSVAAEMRHSETAFVHADGGGFALRWFTPTTEVDLCGHATLATSHVLWTEGFLAETAEACFSTRSGRLVSRRHGSAVEMDFPSWPAEPAPAPEGLAAALGIEPAWVGTSECGYVVEAQSEDDVTTMTPDFARLARVAPSILVTAESHVDGRDVVCRYFAPGYGIDEDPVTGSAHCTIGPYWGTKLGRDTIVSFQASARGGIVRVRNLSSRVRIVGDAITILRGELL